MTSTQAIVRRASTIGSFVDPETDTDIKLRKEHPARAKGKLIMATTDPKPPQNASDLYKNLFATATEFIRSQDQDITQPTRMNLNRVRVIRAPSHQHLFGHNYLVSTKPPFQGVHSLEDFMAHLNAMLPSLDTWDTYITDIVVDETRKMCIVRASYFMKPVGVTDAVENDLVWWLWMDEGGEKVEKAMEFVDGLATGRIRELIMGVEAR
ncbi:hypothetical protein N0V90_009602 [Kalmusia sp. IMI 367209]|nr:hypothetical protein N0V90_009602 [Kalmusia sp. IMI 367209]